jgi:hypothetical protein
MISHALVRSGIRSRGRPISRCRGRCIRRLDFSGVDSFTFVLDIRNKTVLISSVGHNLGTGVGEGNTVRSAGPVSITALGVSKVVGV